MPFPADQDALPEMAFCKIVTIGLQVKNTRADFRDMRPWARPKFPARGPQFVREWPVLHMLCDKCKRQARFRKITKAPSEGNAVSCASRASKCIGCPHMVSDQP